jgi:threonine dehydrogenase-like Zn-dependent dehydrogenase
MKALILRGKDDLAMGEVKKPVPEPDEVLVRTKAATICTSDLIDIASNPFGIKLPMVIGHEGAGVIEAVGDAVRGFAPGNAVTAHPVIPCQKCTSCRRGLYHLCDDMDHLGVYRSGVFAEYFTIRADRIRKKPAGLTFAQSTLMEPVCVCIEAIERANVRAGANVLVLGDGPFGVAIAKLSFGKKPARVVFVGRHPYRLSQVPGAIAINERETDDVVGDILRTTGGEGIDSAVLAVGTARAVDISIASLRSRGTLAVFSGIEGKTPVDLFKLHVKELQIHGSCNDMDCLDEALAALCDERLNLKGLITHELPFSRWREAIAIAKNGKDSALKVSMRFEEEL